ncbi:serine O-acetyltransferase EpsC [Herminiimonas arsenitoxidans]|uniref:serine O-acetyltransferase EpsC n=1 Tax=Herminiimonas arsenitoxidans TaxID=1809410 RepID=UPI000970CCF7|nr:serine O-acetyltransferase EpsC [Herminiimonas arsenitoxidans]
MTKQRPSLELVIPAPVGTWGLDNVVKSLRQSREETHNIRYRGQIRELPSREALEKILDGLSAALFPTHYGQPVLTDESIDYFVGDKLNIALNDLAEQVRRGLLFVSRQGDDADQLVVKVASDARDLDLEAIEITRNFAAQLRHIRDLLVTDLQAAYHGDPAAHSVSEILVCYPGMTAIIYHRFAHALHNLGAPFLARLISRIAHSSTGIDIHPGAEIGGSFFVDHGTGVVIGETAVIGQRVRLYQAVTLGAKRFPADENGTLIKGNPRHPLVEDDVVVYAGATVLGRITIGSGSTIGGGVWLTHSVPPGSNITQAQTRNH